MAETKNKIILVKVKDNVTVLVESKSLGGEQDGKDSGRERRNQRRNNT
jgi:hypothetical protein